MNRRSLAALVLVNAVLLAALVTSLLSPQAAQAQFGSGSQYLMISGQSQVRNDQAAIYIVDTRNGAILALLYNSANNRLEPIAGRLLSQDIQAGGGSR